MSELNLEQKYNVDYSGIYHNTGCRFFGNLKIFMFEPLSFTLYTPLQMVLQRVLIVGFLLKW
jgi:hypothetical protein